MTREKMEFPNTFDEFVKSYGFKDNKEVYTNGSELIPVFRVKQWLDHIEPCEDAVSREQAIKQCGFGMTSLLVADCLRRLPSVTPKQRTGKIIMGGYDCNHYICSECGEDFGWYNKPNHKYCPNCGAKMEGE